MGDLLKDSTIGGINATLNLRLANQALISSNIANAETPGYHAKKIEFEDALRNALSVSERLPLETDHTAHIVRTEAGHIRPDIYENPNGVVNLDDNSVDRNAEQVALAENQIQYDTDAEMLRRKLALLKYAVTEGGSR